jgi:hypothetical protein
VGLDEHWFMDVVVGFPVAVAVQSAFLTSRLAGVRRRLIDVSSCAVLSLAWLIAFRTGWPLLSVPMGSAWLITLATIVWPLYRQRMAIVPSPAGFSSLSRAPRLATE